MCPGRRARLDPNELKGIYMMSLRTSVLVAVLASAYACGEAKDPQDTPVSFIGLRADEISATRAVIRFQTSIPTTCAAEYGTIKTDLSDRATDPSMAAEQFAIDHNIPLEDLTQNTTYYYRGYVVDPQGTVTRSEILSFKTTEDNGPVLKNFALEASISSVSSNFGGGTNTSNWGANNAIDGSMSSEWATAGDGDNAYIVIDLGQSRTLTHVGFRSRKMGDGTSIITQIEFSIDGAEAIGPFETADPDIAYRFPLTPNVTGRMVRMNALSTTSGNTGVKEIELLGTP